MWTSSNTWKGSGCSKAGPFDVSRDYFKELTPDMVENSISELKERNEEGVIDSHENLKSGNRAVFVISGLNDPIVPSKN